MSRDRKHRAAGAHRVTTGPLYIDSIEQALAATLVSRHTQHPTLLATPVGGLTSARAKRVAGIEYAMKLLARPHRSMLDVAVRCGFQTQQHFSRVFRAMMGVSPSEFTRSR